MINQEKTELLARAAVYRQSAASGRLKLKSYCVDKKRSFTAVMIFSGIFVWLIILVLIYLLVFAGGRLDIYGTGGIILLCLAAAFFCALFSALYVISARKIVTRRYRDVRSSLVKYEIAERKLGEYTEKENAAKYTREG